MTSSLTPRLFLALGLGALLCNGAVNSDILPPLKRLPSVALATKLAHPSQPPSLPTDLKTPFNIAGFDHADTQTDKGSGGVSNPEPAKPTTDRDILAYIADKVSPSGTFVINGEPILIISKKKYKVGDQITIGFDGRDFDLEITSIQRTTYSLRLNRAEITRPIKTGKTP